MTLYKYDVYGMATDPDCSGEGFVLASAVGASPLFYDVDVYEVNEDGERVLEDGPLWEFGDLDADEVQTITDLLEDKLQAEFGEWL